MEVKTEVDLNWKTSGEISRYPAEKALLKESGPLDSKGLSISLNGSLLSLLVNTDTLNIFFYLTAYDFNDYINYHVCTFLNVCVGASEIYYVVSDDKARAEYQQEGANALLTKEGKASVFSKCFPKGLKPKLIKSFADIQPYQVLPGHTWIIDQIINNHYKNIWAEKMIQFHSLAMHADTYK
jgi:hypothetical protein